jgi:hypothetical protein
MAASRKSKRERVMPLKSERAREARRPEWGQMKRRGYG